MIAAVEHGDLDVDHRVTSEHAFLHGLLHALVDRGNEAAGDSAALDLVDELVARPRVREMRSQQSPNCPAPPVCFL